jgi:hypothetical protein
VIGEALEKKAAKAAETPGMLAGLGGAAAVVGVITHPHIAIPGLALALAKRVAVERGSTTAAVILDKLATLRGVERAKQVVERQITRGVAGMLPGEERAAVRVRAVQHTGGAEAYDERVAAVQKAARNPAAIAQAAAASIADHAPAAAKAFQSAATRGTTYLASIIPKRKAPPSITPQFDRPHVANALEKASFNRAFDTVHDPMIALAAARDGRLTKEHVKALAAVYPALYAQIVQQTQAKLAILKMPLTTAQKQQVEVLLGRGVDPELTRRYQATYAMSAPKPPNPQQEQHENKSPKRPITAAARNTALDVGRPVGS